MKIFRDAFDYCFKHFIITIQINWNSGAVQNSYRALEVDAVHVHRKKDMRKAT